MKYKFILRKFRKYYREFWNIERNNLLGNQKNLKWALHLSLFAKNRRKLIFAANID